MHLAFLFGRLSAADRSGAPPTSTLPTGNLVVNGDFEQGAKGWPADAIRRKVASIQREGENSWLSISSYGGLAQTIKLDPEWAALRVTARMRVKDVVPGKEGWHDARLAMSFFDAQGKRLDPWPNVFHAQGTGDWVQYDRVYKIPDGAAQLHLAPSMFGASGTADFDAVEVRVARLRSGVAADMPLPEGAEDLRDSSRAWRQTSATRQRICLNGLWRFLPAGKESTQRPPPSGRGWGWFKVPGIWPRSADDAQRVLSPDGYEDSELRDLEQAWYQRPLNVPADWASRKVLLDFTMVQTHARVWIDGREAGEVFFPGGLLDITKEAKPGTAQTLTLLLTARPLEKESDVFMAPDRIIRSKAAVRCRGLTGDVWLRSQPAREALGDVHVVTSTRKGTIAFHTTVQDRGPGKRSLEASVYEGDRLVKTFQGGKEISNGRLCLAGDWADAKLWDLHTPRNIYTAVVTLRDGAGRPLDQSLPIRFGFREFWIDGRDFYLNGSRVHLRALHTTNIASDADQGSIDGCRNTCRRLKEYGFNALITSNYSFAPGDVGYMDALFAAADSEGVLATFSLPHIKDFNMKLDTARQAERYRALCDWLIRRAWNHPSIVMYAMNHNTTGYKGDQNPLWMDGVYAPDAEWAKTNPGRLKSRKQAALAAAIASELDPTRPVYHHQSGNLGDLYTVNIYLNWAPLQERSDWLRHWATRGVKPMFFVEWGLPHVSSWSSYRGPEFIWRAPAFQQVWDSEYAAAYVGQDAYRMTPTKVRSMEWEEELWARGEPFPWSHLIRYFRSQDENYTQIQAMFAADNWRSHRTWGVSAMLPWDQENLWRVPEEAGRRQPVAQPFAHLQRQGIVPDAVAPVANQAIYSRDVSQVRPSELGRAFLRWNMPLCAYLGGAAGHFTEKGHNFSPDETVRKQLIVLNDTRQTTRCKYGWSFSATGRRQEGEIAVAPGDKALVDVAVPLPQDLAPGHYTLSASFDFGANGRQEDSLGIDVLAPAGKPRTRSRVALFDPGAQTGPLLRQLGLEFRSVAADDPLDQVDLLILGRQALAASKGPVPGLDRVAKGLKMLVFEQEADALEQKLGFRINIHGLRQVFARTPSHPALVGLADGQLRDWRGSATIVPPYLDITSVDQNDPKWKWSGFENTRVWRCGNQGSVATVLIEKPDRGDFLPIVDGGFDLQYSSLLEWTLGSGRVIFCQMDVTGRTDSEPAAMALCSNLIRYLDDAKPAAQRPTHWAGDKRTSELLKQLGIAAAEARTLPAAGALMILGPGATIDKPLRPRVEEGLDVLLLGLSEEEIARVLSGVVKLKTGPTVSSMLQPLADPLLAGVSGAELHWRTKPVLAAIQAAHEGENLSLQVVQLGRGHVVLCQAAPWMFDDQKKGYLRTTYRRNVFLISRLLHNLRAEEAATGTDARYLQTPQAEDDPYRYYRW